MHRVYWILGLLLGGLLIYGTAISTWAQSPPDKHSTLLAQPNTGECPNFTDVTAFDYFCERLTEAVARGAISGYTTGCSNGTPCFKPYDQVTRGQFAKMAVLMFGFQYTIPPGQQTFSDVPPGSTFYTFIETAAHQNPPLISGYSGNDCTSQNPPLGSPCFLPYNPVTRGQIAKIASNAAGFADDVSGRVIPKFYDVPMGSTFFPYVERGVMHDTLGPYPPDLTPQPVCGSATQPCYFWNYATFRADAALQIAQAYDLRVGQSGIEAGQTFAQRRSHTYDAVFAQVSTPAYQPNLALGVTIGGPLAITSRWNPYYIETGPAEYLDGFLNRHYNPYYNWNDGFGGHGYGFLTSVNLTPNTFYSYQVVGTPGDVWEAQFCPSSTCTTLATSNALLETPYAVAGAESSNKAIGTGSIEIYYFTVREVGQNPSVSCPDYTLLPWVGYNGIINGCSSPIGDWTMSYSP